MRAGRGDGSGRGDGRGDGHSGAGVSPRRRPSGGGSAEPMAEPTVEERGTEPAPAPLGPLRTALAGDPDGSSYDFSMTNPPFFESLDDAASNRNPRTVCTASAAEAATPGGELAFVAGIVRDSLVLRARVRWYTSLLGRRATLRPLLRTLRDAGVVNVRTTRFARGRTARWAVAWRCVRGVSEVCQRCVRGHVWEGT